MNTDNAVKKNPADYMKILFRRKWLIVLPTIAGIMLGMIAGNVLPKAYESSTLMLVEEGRVINPLIQGLAVSTSVAQRVHVLREQILGWDRLDQLIKKLDLAKDVRSQWEFELLVKKLRKHIIVTLRGQNIIGISYTGSDPIEATNIVKTITDIFISENLRQQTRETEDAVAFINDQVNMFQKKLKESEIAGLEEQLNKLLLDSTERHPMVVELKTKIASAKEEVARGDYAIKTDPEKAQANAELKALKAELSEMKEEQYSPVADGSTGPNRSKLATTSNEKLYKLLLLEKAEKATEKDANVNKKIYDTLLERLETAKITQRLEASKEGTRYTILDPARVPQRPKFPNKPLVLLGGLIAGLCFGIGLVALAEMLDHSFIGIDEARAYLDLPVFGAISKIVTEKDIKDQQDRRVRLTGLSIVLGVVLVVAIIFNVFMGN